MALPDLLTALPFSFWNENQDPVPLWEEQGRRLLWGV